MEDLMREIKSLNLRGLCSGLRAAMLGIEIRIIEVGIRDVVFG